MSFMVNDVQVFFLTQCHQLKHSFISDGYINDLEFLTLGIDLSGDLKVKCFFWEYVFECVVCDEYPYLCRLQ